MIELFHFINQLRNVNLRIQCAEFFFIYFILNKYKLKCMT